MGDILNVYVRVCIYLREIMSLTISCDNVRSDSQGLKTHLIIFALFSNKY